MNTVLKREGVRFNGAMNARIAGDHEVNNFLVPVALDEVYKAQIMSSTFLFAISVWPLICR